MSELAAQNRRIFAACFLAASMMMGLAYAAVPLYDLFCRVTGYGGTPQTGAQLAGKLVEVPLPASTHPPVTIRFDANLHRDMPWVFTAPQGMEVPAGEVGFAYYRAHNPSAEPVTGVASFNVTPQKAAVYFNKLACFCFQEQKLEAGASLDMPVTFFIDPALHQDADMQDVREFVLSYTFFVATPDSPLLAPQGGGMPMMQMGSPQGGGMAMDAPQEGL